MKKTSKDTKAAVMLLDDENNTPGGIAFTRLVLEIFRINGRIIAAGELITRDLDLTSARWQVLGAIAPESLTVAQIARDMGQQRQSVQRIVDILAEEGTVELVPNPHHRRAKLVRPTASGRAKLKRLNQRRIDWSRRVAGDIPAKSIAAALDVLARLRTNLEADAPE